MIIITFLDNPRLLCDFKCVSGDGTFSYSPKHFHQRFTLLVYMCPHLNIYQAVHFLQEIQIETTHKMNFISKLKINLLRNNTKQKEEYTLKL